MNNRRAILWLLLAIVVAVVYDVVFSDYLSNDTDVKRGDHIAFDSELSPDTIVINHCGESCVRLEKHGGWKMTAPFSSEADASEVMRLVDAIEFTKVIDVMSGPQLARTGRRLASFGLENPAMTIVLSDSLRTNELYIGNTTSLSNGVYAKLSKTDEIVILPLSFLHSANGSPDRFRQRSVMSGMAESVVGIEIRKSGKEPIVFSKSHGLWLVNDKNASLQNVESLIATVFNSRAAEFFWPVGASNETAIASASLLSTYGLNPENAFTMVVKTNDGDEHRLTLGGNDGDSRIYALIQNGGAIASVDAALMKTASRDASWYTDRRIFPFDRSSVSSVKITDGEIGYTLARENGGWRMDAPISAVADAAVVEELVSRLVALTDESIADGELMVSVNKTGKVIGVARAGLFSDKIQPTGLRSKEVLKVDPSRVKRLVSISGGKGAQPVSAVYLKDISSWGVESAVGNSTIDIDGVNTVLRTIGSLMSESVVTLKASPQEMTSFGLVRPFFTLSVDTDIEGAVRRNIIIGSETDGGRYATIGANDAVFVLSDRVVAALMSSLVD